MQTESTVWLAWAGNWAGFDGDPLGAYATPERAQKAVLDHFHLASGSWTDEPSPSVFVGSPRPALWLDQAVLEHLHIGDDPADRDEAFGWISEWAVQ